MITKKKMNLPIVSLLLVFAASMITAVLVNIHNASAAPLTQTLVRFDRMKISTGTTGTVCAKPATTATEASVQVTFPTGYTLGTAANFTVNTTNLAWPGVSPTAWPGIATASNVTGQVVTFASSDLTVGTLYCFNWTNAAAVTVKSSATSSNTGTITTRTSAPATIDSSDFSTASISDDQIVVSASVPQSFSFALSGNTDNLGVLTTGSVISSPTPRTATVNTNAKNGWNVWAKDSNTGLNSASAGATIASRTPGTSSTLNGANNTEGYNMGVTTSQGSGTGTITVPTEFIGSAATGGGLDTSLRSIASSNGTAGSAVLTLTNNVTISSTTASASDYTDTITVVGAGLF